MPIDICRLTAALLPWALPSVLLSACAVSPPRPTSAALQPASQAWQAPLPSVASSRAQWWAAWQDPLLDDLLLAAQQSNPSLQQAQARIAEARYQAEAAGAALWPAVKLNAASTRSRNATQQPDVAQTYRYGSLDASWEVDLWGGVAAVRQGLLASLAGREAEQQDALASLAAEVANSLVAYRAYATQLSLLDAELRSRELSQQLVQSRQRAGFASTVDVALTDAALADARSQRTDSQAGADVSVKALVALTGLDEPTVRAKLGKVNATWPTPPAVLVETVPAKVLLQRPDIRIAAATLDAAAADAAVAEVALYPSLSLLGSIGRASLDNGVAVSGSTWSFGPSLSVPIFNAGRLEASRQAAVARYTQTLASYQTKVRNAVRDVEEALVRLDASNRRQADIQRMVSAYRLQFESVEARWRTGSASVSELEDARRLWLTQATRDIALRREQASLAIALYKAVGGSYLPAASLP